MSAGWDAQQLLQPITADQPCGENLENTQLLASFDSFRVFGQGLPPEVPPEWSQIRTASLEALGKSKDLRLLAHLGAAMLRTDGFPAFFETLNVASYWLEGFWSQTYPLIDEDAILRRNALNCFADHVAVVDALRRLPLVTNRQLGAFSLRDIEIAAGQIPPSANEGRPDQTQIGAAFGAMPLDALRSLHEGAGGAMSALKSIDTRMREEGGVEAGPSFDPLSAQLVKVERVLREQLAAHPEQDASVADGLVAGETKGFSGGAIRSRQDAVRALDAVAAFFRQSEPSSPVPLFLDRAKRLVSKDFLEVLADIAPDGLAQARVAGGVKESE